MISSSLSCSYNFLGLYTCFCFETGSNWSHGVALAVNVELAGLELRYYSGSYCSLHLFSDNNWIDVFVVFLVYFHCFLSSSTLHS